MNKTDLPCFPFVVFVVSRCLRSVCVLTHQSSLLFAFQSGTRVKNVYASLANGTLVVFTPKTVSTARRCSHNDVTLVTKEDDEQVTRESDKWSNLQVCDISFNVNRQFLSWRVMKILTQLFRVCWVQSVILIFLNLNKSCSVFFFYQVSFILDVFLGS